MDVYVSNFTNNNFENAIFWEAWISTLIFIFISYLVGSINSGQILSKIKNRDLGNTGSSNYGATNAGRAFGVKGFAIVFMGDFLKPIILAIIFSLFWVFTDFFSYANVGFALLFVFVGHVWPIWFNFRGGKGIAVFFGLVTVYNFLISGLGGLLFLFYFWVSKRVGFSSIASIFSIAILLTFQPIWPLPNTLFGWANNWGVVISIWIAFLISFVKHLPNLKRFLNELKYGKIVEE